MTTTFDFDDDHITRRVARLFSAPNKPATEQLGADAPKVDDAAYERFLSGDRVTDAELAAREKGSDDGPTK